MRPLVIAFLLVLAFAAFFIAVAAVGIVGLSRGQAALTVPANGSPGAAPSEGKPDAGPAASAGDSADDPVDPAALAGAAPQGGQPGGEAIPILPPPPHVLPPAPAVAGPIDLPALAAVTHGKLIHVEPIVGGYTVADWRDSQAYVEWAVAPHAAGWYRVELSFACDNDAGGGYVVAVAEQTVTGRARPTGGWNQFRTTSLGTIHLTTQDTRLTLRPDGPMARSLMNLRHVRLVPAAGGR